MITTGVRLGPYEIVESLGAGGMGEVWRAKDTRLDRQVAIKVLPAGLTENEQLHARFDREAKAISSLNHPNICTLHDVGHENGRHYLVMELIEGESLADRLDKGPLPLDEAIRHGIEITNALDRAHRQGIIHRDLKPGNVMITPSGAKILDFGLAKMADQASESEPGITNLPTQKRNLTEEGTILGTVQYMAPEQIEGHEADRRTDIFAFGLLLFEMVTGRKAFQGKSRMSLMAAILEHRPPSISSVQPISPPALDRLVQICLEKDPDNRWQTARDVELQLRWIEEGGSDAGIPAPVMARRKHREKAGWVAAAVAAAMALLFAALWLAHPDEPRRLSRFSMLPPPGMTIDVGMRLAISPDGSRLVFAAFGGQGPRRLYLREIDQLESRPLTGTERGELPFWSPDSREIAFFVDDRLKRVSAFGGPPQTICEAAAPRGGSWANDGTIVFSSGEAGGRGVLSKVAARGGQPVRLTELDEQRGDFSHRWPWFLPDEKHLLFLAQTGEGGREDDDSTIEVLSLETGERKRIVGGNSSVQYVPPGYILFWREGSLIAQKFDLDRLEVSGEPVPIAERVGYSGLEKGAFTASSEGTLLYQSNEAVSSQLTWFDRDGSELSTIGEESRQLGSIDLSWDGSRLAYTLEGDVWVRDLVRGSAIRLSFDDEWEGDPVWLPGDDWIVFNSPTAFFRKRSSGIGDAERLIGDDQEAAGAYSSSSDGRYLFVHQDHPATQVDILRFDMIEEKFESLIRTPFLDVTPYPSPDGKWLAVASAETGRMEVYVHRLESPGGRWQLSTDGGVHPTWSRDGGTIYYLTEQSSRLMAVEVETGETFRAGTPVELMRVAMPRRQERPYDVNADGSRFIFNALTGDRTESPEITVVMNWDRMLER